MQGCICDNMMCNVRSGARVTIFEQGPRLCSNVRSWGHVTLFSPNSLNMSTLGKQILTEMQVEKYLPDIIQFWNKIHEKAKGFSSRRGNLPYWVQAFRDISWLHWRTFKKGRTALNSTAFCIRTSHEFQNSQCKVYLNCKGIGVSRESLLKSDLSKRRKSCKFRILCILTLPKLTLWSIVTKDGWRVHHWQYWHCCGCYWYIW